MRYLLLALALTACKTAAVGPKVWVTSGDVMTTVSVSGASHDDAKALAMREAAQLGLKRGEKALMVSREQDAGGTYSMTVIYIDPSDKGIQDWVPVQDRVLLTEIVPAAERR